MKLQATLAHLSTLEELNVCVKAKKVDVYNTVDFAELSQLFTEESEQKLTRAH